MGTLSSALKGKRILVAEDDEDLRPAIQQLLEARGAHVRIAENGLIAKRILENGSQFDLLISDVQMPELDGLQLMSFARVHAPKMKILIFTGFSDQIKSKDGSELGSDGFLAKPFRLKDLLALLTDLIQSPERTAEPASSFLVTSRQAQSPE